MSKMLYLTPEKIEECQKKFAEALSNMKLADGKVSFTESFDYPKERRAKLIISEKAYVKTLYLVFSQSKEVAWHGLARRGENDTYFIDDILIYPQEVTGATVNTDQVKYQNWLYSFDDDVFNAIRMQGHSHVNMNVSPSGVDLDHQNKIIGQMKHEDFYVFMIWNKNLSRNIRIFDMKSNVFFETADCDLVIADGDYKIKEFMSDIEENVSEKKFTPPAKATTATGAREYWSGYNPLTYHTPVEKSKKETEPVAAPKKSAEAKKSTEKEKKKDAIIPKYSAQSSLYDYGYEYEDDLRNPYSAFGYV